MSKQTPRGSAAAGQEPAAEAADSHGLFDWLEADPDHRALTTANGRVVHASGLLPQANVAALTITAQADLVRLLEDAEFSGNAVTVWSKDVAYAISHEDRTWTVHGTAGSVEAPASEAAQEPTRAHTEVDRVLRNARDQIMGAAASASELHDELRPRLFPLSVADLADQMIIMIEHS